MSISQLLIIAAFAVLIGQLQTGWPLVLFGVSAFVVYWLQQPVQPHGGMEPPREIVRVPPGRTWLALSPLLIVNEPVDIAPTADTKVRYNAAYPRWAHDQYREAMAAQAQRKRWQYLDLRNAIPPEGFWMPACTLVQRVRARL